MGQFTYYLNYITLRIWFYAETILALGSIQMLSLEKFLFYSTEMIYTPNAYIL